MIIEELVALLLEQNQKAKVRVSLDGSIFPTDNIDENRDYNREVDSNTPGEFFIVALTEFEEE